MAGQIRQPGKIVFGTKIDLDKMDNKKKGAKKKAVVQDLPMNPEFDLRRKLEQALAILNPLLKEAGMLELAIVDPKEILPSEKNARYMPPEVFKQLTSNIKQSGLLEGTPLVVKRPEGLRLISGNHRVSGAIEAGIPLILVMVYGEVLSQEEAISKQLAHNALVGFDDKVILQELFESLRNIELKMQTGLASELEKMSYPTLRFRAGDYKTISLVFLPEDLGLSEERMEEICNSLPPLGDGGMLLKIEYWQRFSKILQRIKKTENIKNNALAFERIIEIAWDHVHG